MRFKYDIILRVTTPGLPSEKYFLPVIPFSVPLDKGHKITLRRITSAERQYTAEATDYPTQIPGHHIPSIPAEVNIVDDEEKKNLINIIEKTYNGMKITEVK